MWGQETDIAPCGGPRVVSAPRTVPASCPAGVGGGVTAPASSPTKPPSARLASGFTWGLPLPRPRSARASQPAPWKGGPTGSGSLREEPLSAGGPDAHPPVGRMAATSRPLPSRFWAGVSRLRNNPELSSSKHLAKEAKYHEPHWTDGETEASALHKATQQWQRLE